MTATRGRPMTPGGVIEEAQCELVATGFDLIGHDLFELDAYASLTETLQAIAAMLRLGDSERALRAVEECYRRVIDVRRRDLGENAGHRKVLRIARGEEVAR